MRRIRIGETKGRQTSTSRTEIPPAILRDLEEFGGLVGVLSLVFVKEFQACELWKGMCDLRRPHLAKLILARLVHVTRIWPFPQLHRLSLLVCKYVSQTSRYRVGKNYMQIPYHNHIVFSINQVGAKMSFESNDGTDDGRAFSPRQGELEDLRSQYNSIVRIISLYLSRSKENKPWYRILGWGCCLNIFLFTSLWLWLRYTISSFEHVFQDILAKIGLLSTDTFSCNLPSPFEVTYSSMNILSSILFTN